jgi:hypothetical protein
MARIVVIFRLLLICIYILSVTNFSYDPCQILAEVKILNDLRHIQTVEVCTYVKSGIAQHSLVITKYLRNVWVLVLVAYHVLFIQNAQNKFTIDI